MINTDEHKKEAIAKVLAGEGTLKEISSQYGYSYQSLHRWVQDVKKSNENEKKGSNDKNLEQLLRDQIIRLLKTPLNPQAINQLSGALKNLRDSGGSIEDEVERLNEWLDTPLIGSQLAQVDKR
jgi:transposase-like protein